MLSDLQKISDNALIYYSYAVTRMNRYLLSFPLF